MLHNDDCPRDVLLLHPLTVPEQGLREREREGGSEGGEGGREGGREGVREVVIKSESERAREGESDGGGWTGG